MKVVKMQREISRNINILLFVFKVWRLRLERQVKKIKEGTKPLVNPSLMHKSKSL